MRYGDLLKNYIDLYHRHYIVSAENLGPMYYVMDDVGNNFFDVGIAEQGMLGIAAGLAIRKKVPVVHAMSAFLMMRAFEFIRTDAGFGNLAVKMVGTSSGILSAWNGATHQSIEDISLAMSIPNLNIFCPSDNGEMIEGLEKILLDDKPWYIRYNDCVPSIEHSRFDVIGKGEIIGNNSEIAIVTYGYMLNIVNKAADYLKNQYGIDVDIVNLRTIRPLDEEMLIDVANNHSHVICVEDHLTYGGAFTVISDFFARNNISSRMSSVAFRDYFCSGQYR
jgi:transketolase